MMRPPFVLLAGVLAIAPACSHGSDTANESPHDRRPRSVDVLSDQAATPSADAISKQAATPSADASTASATDPSAPKNSAAPPSLGVKLLSARPDGLVSLELALDLEKEAVIYSWNGSPAPMFPNHLRVEVLAPKQPRHVLVIKPGARPKFPHPSDAVTAQQYRYPRPLEFYLFQDGARYKSGDHFEFDKPGKAPEGCLTLQVTYDSHSKYFDRHGFTQMRVVGEPFQACFQPTETL